MKYGILGNTATPMQQAIDLLITKINRDTAYLGGILTGTQPGLELFDLQRNLLEAIQAGHRAIALLEQDHATQFSEEPGPTPSEANLPADQPEPTQRPDPEHETRAMPHVADGPPVDLDSIERALQTPGEVKPAAGRLTMLSRAMGRVDAQEVARHD